MLKLGMFRSKLLSLSWKLEQEITDANLKALQKLLANTARSHCTHCLAFQVKCFVSNSSNIPTSLWDLFPGRHKVAQKDEDAHKLIFSYWNHIASCSLLSNTHGLLVTKPTLLPRHMMQHTWRFGSLSIGLQWSQLYTIKTLVFLQCNRRASVQSIIEHPPLRAFWFHSGLYV